MSGESDDAFDRMTHPPISTHDFVHAGLSGLSSSPVVGDCQDAKGEADPERHCNRVLGIGRHPLEDLARTNDSLSNDTQSRFGLQSRARQACRCSDAPMLTMSATVNQVRGRLRQRIKILFAHQYDVSRAPCCFCRAVHGNADVRLFQSWCIVDAVTCHANHVVAILQDT